MTTSIHSYSKFDIAVDVLGCVPVVSTFVGLIEMIYSFALTILSAIYSKIAEHNAEKSRKLHKKLAPEVHDLYKKCMENLIEIGILGESLNSDLETLTNLKNREESALKKMVDLKEKGQDDQILQKQLDQNRAASDALSEYVKEKQKNYDEGRALSKKLWEMYNHKSDLELTYSNEELKQLELAVKYNKIGSDLAALYFIGLIRATWIGGIGIALYHVYKWYKLKGVVQDSIL